MAHRALACRSLRIVMGRREDDAREEGGRAERLEARRKHRPPEVPEWLKGRKLETLVEPPLHADDGDPIPE